MELTGEQKRRIEENRLAALARLESKRVHSELSSLSSDPKSPVLSLEHVFPAGIPETQSPPLQSEPVKPATPPMAQAQPPKKAEKKTLKSVLVSPSTVSIEGGEALMFKGFQGAYFKAGRWHLPLRTYKQFTEKVKVDEGVPENVIDVLLAPRSPKQFTFDGSIPEKLDKSLFPFQRDGVQWILSRNGRVILADEMGLGKSIQALAIAAYYRREWPLLIIAPASMVASWCEQVVRWYSMPAEQIAVAYDGRALLNSGHVNIVSYDLAVRLIDQIKQLKPGVVISDECHCLRNQQTKRVKTLGPVLKKAGRLVMLSGTPALSRPIELFPQLAIVCPGLFPRQLDFGTRYCGARRDRFGWNFRGATCLKELGIILEETVMLRRNKKQVLSQLPRKIRQQVFVRIEGKLMRELKLLSDSISSGDWATFNGLEEAQRKGELMALWRRTGEAKFPAMWLYISDLLDLGSEDVVSLEDADTEQDKKKLLLFAHHQSMLDQFEEKLIAQKIKFIRIDGKTPPSARQALCNQFQNDRSVRVALLSITAASVGLTLTAATLVVFAELFFNPGILVQAEDRAHRIGQTDSVTVHYMLARGTIDDRLWPLLLGKLNTLESVRLGENDFAGMRQVEHDERQLKLDRYLV